MTKFKFKIPGQTDDISTGNDKPKPPILPPIFDDRKTVAHLLNPIFEWKTRPSQPKSTQASQLKSSDIVKGASQPKSIDILKGASHTKSIDDGNESQPKSVDDGKGLTISDPTINEKNPFALQPQAPDKIKPSFNTLKLSDNKGSSTKSLSGFAEFTTALRPFDKKNTLTESPPSQNNQNKLPSQSTADGSKTTKMGCTEASATLNDNENSKKKNYIWLAAAAAGICGMGLVCNSLYFLWIIDL